MLRNQGNAHFRLFSVSFFSVRRLFWPLIIPSVAVLFLVFCPCISALTLKDKFHTHQENENPDRTVARLGSRELLQTTTPIPLPFFPFSSSPPPPSPNLLDLNHALYVITLDGKITAIDAQHNGRQLWTADTGAALVDSSLSKIEISRDSRSVRLIPSLIGGLYEKYDEDGHVEPLPFDADALLDASFNLHDELIITGGKHIDSLGLDLHTGQVLYSFAKQDHNRTTASGDSISTTPTLVVKRTTQTVRARSARNGHEKWNFSVSNHHLVRLKPQASTIVVGNVEGHGSESENIFPGNFEYQLQTGVILAFNNDGLLAWSSSIHAPIAAVWELKNGELHERSLFETTNQFSASIDDEEEEETIHPVPARRIAFVGEFNSTPYVIVSPRVQRELIHDAQKKRASDSYNSHRPMLASWHKAYQKRTLSTESENTASLAIGAGSVDYNYPLALRPDTHSSSASTETCDTAGYLALIGPRSLEDRNLLKDEEMSNDIQTPTRWLTTTNTLTIWSVFICAVIIMIVWLIKEKQADRLRCQMLIADSTTTTSSAPPTPEYHQIEHPLIPPFQSRYFLEYEHVRFLGRGGFGVVFEAINKLDERRVAIKRVSLKKATGKERALKEIRCLAVLNHPNLIQYYYAWNESPPIQWQEEEDKRLLLRNNRTTPDSISTFPTSAQSAGDSESNVPVIKSSPLIDFTFDHSTNPLRLHEDFSGNDDIQNSTSSLSSLDNNATHPRDANNNNKLPISMRNHSNTTKSSYSSSSPLFDHSSDSSSSAFIDEKKREISISDDGIVFLHDDAQDLPPPAVLPIVKKKESIEADNDDDQATTTATYFYFVMELCKAESLRDRLTERNIDRHEAWSIFDQIIKGIEYIHSQKLIHRDLKPSNILFSLENTVKIGDFGLVSAFGEDKLPKIKKRIPDGDFIEAMSQTMEGGGNDELGGTMLYMSPEQINREPYNQKVDIYAMGIILFELLYPFSTQMERIRALADVRKRTPVFPKDFEVGGSNRNQLLCRMIRWLLSYTPRDRPRAGELRQDTFYLRMLHVEMPHLFCPDTHQQHLTVVNGHDQVSPSPTYNNRRGRISSSSSSPFRRALSSSALHSRSDSEPRIMNFSPSSSASSCFLGLETTHI